LVATPSSTVVTNEQVSGQSCGQAPSTVVDVAVAVRRPFGSCRGMPRGEHRELRGVLD
jgi:hypothetical protein